MVYILCFKNAFQIVLLSSTLFSPSSEAAVVLGDDPVVISKVSRSHFPTRPALLAQLSLLIKEITLNQCFAEQCLCSLTSSSPHRVCFAAAYQSPSFLSLCPPLISSPHAGNYFPANNFLPTTLFLSFTDMFTSLNVLGGLLLCLFSSLLLLSLLGDLSFFINPCFNLVGHRSGSFSVSPPIFSIPD